MKSLIILLNLIYCIEIIMAIRILIYTKFSFRFYKLLWESLLVMHYSASERKTFWYPIST